MKRDKVDCVTRKVGGKIKTTVYEKPTDNGAVLSYSSAHPKSVFASIASSMFRRVRALCTDEADRTAAQIEVKNKLWARVKSTLTYYMQQTSRPSNKPMNMHAWIHFEFNSNLDGDTPSTGVSLELVFRLRSSQHPELLYCDDDFTSPKVSLTQPINGKLRPEKQPYEAHRWAHNGQKVIPEKGPEHFAYSVSTLQKQSSQKSANTKLQCKFRLTVQQDRSSTLRCMFPLHEQYTQLMFDVGTIFEIPQYIFLKEITHKVAENASTAHDQFHPSWAQQVDVVEEFSATLLVVSFMKIRCDILNIVRAET
ncbi:hypothetical protein CLF_106623 [Clonorchis sinensis]|uniref:Helix-turn-helix domain-containing protein n=1 Tax=Clonorchis sinensis TaxID=79923 RepID=G7YFF3_CLOSI|nr:hypothetical protein CLF_106623 [Clonorchis sinensis]